MNLTGIIAVAILIIVLIISQKFIGQVENGTTQDNGSSPLTEGYSLTDAVLDQRNELGQTQYRLYADKIAELPRQDRVILSQVRLSYPAGPNGHGWDISAESGEVSGDGQQVWLRNNVRAEELRPNGMRLIKTSELEFDASQSIASTPAEVIVELDGKTLSATGMVADLKADTVELQSTVSAHIEP